MFDSGLQGLFGAGIEQVGRQFAAIVQIWLYDLSANRLAHIFGEQYRILGDRRRFAQCLQNADRVANGDSLPQQILKTFCTTARGSNLGTKSSTTLGFSSLTRSRTFLASWRENNSWRGGAALRPDGFPEC